MRLYISSVMESVVPFEEKKKLVKDKHILLSYAYYKPNQEPLFEPCKSLLIDSGAFTFMNQTLRKGKKDFDCRAYTKKYAEFIKSHNFDNFIELDIDGVYGFEVYKDCLHILQDITGKNPIPVYHRWRGLEYYKELVKKYKWVALGDVDPTHKTTTQEDYYSWFVNYAHKYGCKVHGLAFTNLKELEWIPFDSVDSSSWTTISRFASVKTFNGHNLWRKDCKRSEFGGLKGRPCETLGYSLKEWGKLSEYMDREYLPIW